MAIAVGPGTGGRSDLQVNDVLELTRRCDSEAGIALGRPTAQDSVRHGQNRVNRGPRSGIRVELSAPGGRVSRRTE